jgi:hypothetical protein
MSTQSIATVAIWSMFVVAGMGLGFVAIGAAGHNGANLLLGIVASLIGGVGLARWWPDYERDFGR